MPTALRYLPQYMTIYCSRFGRVTGKQEGTEFLLVCRPGPDDVILTIHMTPRSFASSHFVLFVRSENQ